MTVRVFDPNEAHKELIKNLFVFYRYDLMPFVESGPTACINSHGVIAYENENVFTHSESVAKCGEFWEQRLQGVIFPMLVELDHKPAGFAIVGGKPYVDPSVDYRLYDFYVLNKYRRQNVARKAAFQIFDRFPGWWEMGWLSDNRPAASCWLSIVNEYTSGNFENWLYDGDLPGVKFLSNGQMINV
ncbi:MAG: hypothetical protein ACYC27_18225 [Armatimonadota bacterium]